MAASISQILNSAIPHGYGEIRVKQARGPSALMELTSQLLRQSIVFGEMVVI